MTSQAILLVSCLLLAAFGVERLSRLAGIPAVVVLIGIGAAGKPLLAAAGVTLEGVNAAVPVMGTVGLILIVLEGAFDLQLKRAGLRLSLLALLSASLGLLANTALFGLLGAVLLGLSAYDALLLALPFSVISSAVAIPSSSFLPKAQREFVVYESSISDILAILLFSAVLDANGSWQAIPSTLAVNGLLSIVLGALCAVGLLYALFKSSGHIRFVPLLASLFALYATGKLLHLSPLVMVLMLGLILNNPHVFARFSWLRGIVTDAEFSVTVREFRSLTAELTFAVRGLFFVLLGYWTDMDSVGHWGAWLGAALLLLGIYGSRYLLLRLLRVDLSAALTWLAPRGLISVLLYVSAKDVVQAPPYLDGALTLVVLLSSLAMSLGRWRMAAGRAPTAAARADQ